MWMIARDDSKNLSHYGVPGMKKGVRKDREHERGGYTGDYTTIKNIPNRKLNRPTHGSLAGVPSNLTTMSRISFKRTNNSRYAGKNEDGDTIYRTTGLMVKSRQANPTRKLNTQLTNNQTHAKFVTSGAEIKKKLQSNNRYKSSRAGMPSYLRS